MQLHSIRKLRSFMAVSLTNWLIKVMYWTFLDLALDHQLGGGCKELKAKKVQSERKAHNIAAGETMAETLLSVAVDKLLILLGREFKRFHGVDQQFNDLRSKINLLTSFMEDAEAKKHKNKTVKTCVEDMKEIVYDAEDIIETFLLKEQLGEASGIKKHMKRLSFIVTDRRKLASEMEDISKRISDVITNLKNYGVVENVSSAGNSSQSREERREREMRETFSSGNESFLVGLEKNVEMLVRYLVEEDDINQVVSIIGMGGIGKTTLAQQVFNHEIVKNHFEKDAWVCVSQEFRRRVVWEEMLRNLSPIHDQERRVSDMSDTELRDKLFRLLETNKSLIVLDDVWKNEDWDLIKPVFPPNKGWKVLLTSRNGSVALHAGPKCIIFKPECLSSQESWELFLNIVFPKNNGTELKVDVEMEEIGKQMMEHCGGLPLAIKVLGGLLKNKQYTFDEWKRVHENIGSHLINEETNLIHHVLSLSFEELPVYLKHCFLYLAHFPEDYAIKVEELSYYWAAEEIHKPGHYNGRTILDVGQGYIEELVKRNMVISQRDVETKRFKECQLHDMMREVCLLKAKQENFLQIVGNQTDTSTANSPSPYRPRRLVIYQAPDGKIDPERMINNPKLRSFLCFDDFIMIDRMASRLCFEKLKLLRVLYLPYAKFESKKLLSNIGNLIQLRYLSLDEATISHIPNSLRNLKLLLYLNLCVDCYNGPTYVPNIFKEMQELRYLSLPKKIHEETKLELGNLVKLETLENISTKHGNVNDLRRMKRLRKLSMVINGGCTIETLSSSLCELRHLEDLDIKDQTIHIEESLTIRMVDAAGLVLDCAKLKRLVLKIKIPRLPDEKHIPCLTIIYLSNTYLEEDPMPILEKLLHLTQVWLWDRSFCGKKMVCSASGFPKLETLVISFLEEWEEWIVEETSMPVLHKLTIDRCLKWEEWIVEETSMPLLHTLTINDCLKLKELPEGLRFMTSLKDLSITETDVNSGPVYVPNIFKEMQELRHLYLPHKIHGNTKLELGNLVNLETLRDFSTKNINVEDLRGMTRLRKLSILFNGGCTLESLSSSLLQLTHLEILDICDHTIHYLESPTIRMVDVTGLFLACANLKELVLKIKMARLPDEQHFPSCLTTIYLTNCCLEEDPMPILEKLLHLTQVSLWNRSFGGKRMVCSASGFPKLERLVIDGLEEWEEWIVEETSMPLLHTLTILGCLKLKKLPEGLRFMTSLKDLDIWGMKKEFVEKLKEGREDYYKIQHIPRVGF